MSDQLYANGRIAVLSNKLLGSDKFLRLSECVSVAEALKVLGENGYATADGNDYEIVLIFELDKAMALLAELCYDKNATQYFLCRYAYHNAKLLMKRKYMRTSGTDGCFSTVGDPVKLQEGFIDDDYSMCSANMAEACDKIDTAFAEGNRSPQVVDVQLDKAMFADMQHFAKHSSIPLVKKLFQWEVDTINLMLLYRLHKAGLDKADLQQWLLDGGTVKRDTLLALWDKSDVALSEKLQKFYALCNLDNPDLQAAEAAQKAGRNLLIAENADNLTIQPIIAYFYNKVDEIDKVRKILICIKNGIDKETIKKSIKIN